MARPKKIVEPEIGTPGGGNDPELAAELDVALGEVAQRETKPLDLNDAEYLADIEAALSHAERMIEKGNKRLATRITDRAAVSLGGYSGTDTATRHAEIVGRVQAMPDLILP